MEYRQIGLGTRLELTLYDEKGVKTISGLVSRYETYFEDLNLMEIYAPFCAGRVLTVQHGMKMEISFPKGKNIYAFLAEAIERNTRGEIAFLIVRPLSAIEKVQRRNFFRMDCDIETHYRPYEPSLPKEATTPPMERARSRNISGGGLCLVTYEFYEAGSLLEIKVMLDDMIRVVAKVVRSVGVKKKGRIVYETGVKFINIKNTDREKIVSYIFEVQRDRLKKGRFK